MSQENVELARRAWELLSQGADDEIARRLAPDVEWHHQIGLGTPAEGIYRGREEVLKSSATFRDSFGRCGSRSRTATPFGAVTDVLAGLVMRQRFWMDQSRALEAARLRE